MTTFRQVFMELFHRRNRLIKFILSVQLIIFLFELLLKGVFNLNATSSYWLSFGQDLSLYQTLLNVTLITSAIFDIGFLIWTCFQNEKNYLSQTWNLLPISNYKVYLASLLSTLVNCVVIFIPQILVITICEIADYISSTSVKTTFLNELQRYVFMFWNNEFFTVGLYLVLVVLIILTFVSFVNFSSRVITDFLPVKNPNTVRIVVMTILVLIGAYFAFQIEQGISKYLIALEMRIYNDSHVTNSYIQWVNRVDVLLPTSVLGIAGLAFGGLDLWLYEKFVEPKISNY